MINPDLVDRIYEAAAMPELWPEVLSGLGRLSGAAGGLFFSTSRDSFTYTAAPEVCWIVEEYVAEGWMADNVRGAPLIAELFPGFRTDADYRDADERAAIPVYRDFLIPRGIDAAAGTIFQGIQDDAIVLTLEHFPSHERAAAAVPMLDLLRPDLARALSLSAALKRSQASNAVRSLEYAGVGADLVSKDGRLRSINDRFVTALGNRILDRASTLAFADRFVQANFSAAIAEVEHGAGVKSVATSATENLRSIVLHLIPLRRGARDVFGWDGILVLLAEPANATIPNADLLRLLFDLTPAEARLTRLLLEGQTAADAAIRLGITENTSRTHLRRIFAKVGVSRQTELLRLLLGLGAP